MELKNIAQNLSLDEAAEIVGVTTRTLQRYHRLGIGPARIKLPQKVKYRRADLEAWLDSFREPAGPRVEYRSIGADGVIRRTA